MFRTNSKLNNNLNSKDQTPLVPDSSLLIKEGYITKFKSKKKRWFALYTENDNEPAHLDYYENEKKFKTSPCSFKRSILLKDCFAVIKKTDPRFQKSNIFVFAIYTRDDCFSLMFDSENEMSSWFALINEVHLKSIAKNNMIHDYDKIWYVVIRDKKSIIKGSFYLCLTSEEIHLYKIQNLKENKKTGTSDQSANNQQSELTTPLIEKTLIDPVNLNHTPLDKMQSFRFPFSLIRSFGHQSNCLFIQLGRSSDLGSCQLWFELKDCDTSQHIHSLVASTRTASKSNEFRTRSNSENNRMFSRQNKSSLSDKTSVNSTSISQSNTNTSINQQLNNLTNKSSSNSLKFNNNQKVINCDNKVKNEKENSNEYISSPVYTSVACSLLGNNMPIRSRSTSESSSCQAAFHAQPKVFQSLLKSRHLNSQSSNSNLLSSSVLSNDSIQSKEDNDGSDYYIVTPTARESLPSACIKEEDYLVVGELNDSLAETKSPPTETKAVPDPLPVELDNLSKVDNLTLVPTGHLASKLPNSSSSSYTLENAQHYKHNAQYYQPISSSFVELPDSVAEELNENGQIDEYIQVELGLDRKNKLASSKPKPANHDSQSKTNLESASSDNQTKSKPIESQQSLNLDDDEEYIGVESISSTNTATNLESENFEINNLSPISSTSGNMNRVKTFSTSSNNTSNNELNSLGTSPSLLSNAFYNTSMNHAKEETFKLDKVKSYFNSTEDCDYIKPARTYSMGSRPQLANHSKLKHASCSMTKSNTSNTIGSSISNNLLNKKVQCGHLIDPACIHLDEAFVKDNRVRAYSMGSHSTVKKDLLRKIKLSHLQKRQESKQGALDGNEGNEQNEKCLSTPLLISKDTCTARNRSATFTSTLNSSASSSSKKTVNEESSEEDDLMTIDFDRLDNNVPRIENHDYMDSFTSFNQISIQNKFKELSLDTGETLKTKD